MLQLKSLHDLPECRLAVHTAQPAYISCAAERRDLPAPLYAQVIEIPKQEARVKRISCADGIGDPDFFRLPVVSPAIGGGNSTSAAAFHNTYRHDSGGPLQRCHGIRLMHNAA